MNQANEKLCVEFAVNLDDGEEDLKKVKEIISSTKGCRLISSDVANKTIQLELDQEEQQQQPPFDNPLQDSPGTALKNCCPVNAAADQQTQHDDSSTIQDIQRLIEKETGIITVVKGFGNLNSAVAELRPPDSHRSDTSGEHFNSQFIQREVVGVVRLSQLPNEKCFLDGLLDGFKIKDCNHSENFSFAIHEYGDLEGPSFDSIGEPIIHVDSRTGQEISKDSSFSVRKVIPNCDIAKMIGMSVGLTQSSEGSSLKRVISAGVIARAAIVEANPKQICSCSGKTIWQERIERQTSGTQ